jgi:hypothetical protein
VRALGAWLARPPGCIIARALAAMVAGFTLAALALCGAP